MSRTDKIILAVLPLVMAALGFILGVVVAPQHHATIGDHQVPAIHCVEDNVIGFTEAGQLACIDGGR